MKEIFYDWFGYNTEIFYFLNHLGNSGILPEVLRCFSWVFNIENFAGYYLLLCGWSYWSITRRPRNYEFFSIYKALVRIGICYAVFGLVYAALKFSINLPRPFCSLSGGSFQTIMHTADERCMSSFPSSHAGLALMVTILAWGCLGRLARACAIIITIMVAFSRIALAMHYPADVFYSYLIVLAVLGLSQMIFRMFEHNLVEYVGKRLERLFV